MDRARITKQNRDAQGNAGMIQELGDHPTVEVAKGYAEAYARRTHPNGNLHWRQFSPITWGLMNGQTDTGILIYWTEAP